MKLKSVNHIATILQDYWGICNKRKITMLIKEAYRLEANRKTLEVRFKDQDDVLPPEVERWNNEVITLKVKVVDYLKEQTGREIYL